MGAGERAGQDQPARLGPTAHGEDWLDEDLDSELELGQVADLEY